MSWRKLSDVRSVSNTTVVTNLNADMVDGFNVYNSFLYRYQKAVKAEIVGEGILRLTLGGYYPVPPIKFIAYSAYGNTFQHTSFKIYNFPTNRMVAKIEASTNTSTNLIGYDIKRGNQGNAVVYLKLRNIANAMPSVTIYSLNTIEEAVFITDGYEDVTFKDIKVGFSTYDSQA